MLFRSVFEWARTLLQQHARGRKWPIGDREQIQQLPWEAMPGVEKAVPVLKPFKFVSRDFQEEDSIVKVGSVYVGAGELTVVAGPCAVENRDQLFRTAEAGIEWAVAQKFVWLHGGELVERSEAPGEKELILFLPLCP